MRNHYNYVFDDLTLTYNFVTKNKILYRVAFIVDETFSSISGDDIQNIYQFVVEKANANIEQYDPKVSKTIGNIIEQFFNQKENSLIYISSNDKNKSRQRHKIFDRWYRSSKSKNDIIKIDNIITIKSNDIEVDKIYTSFLLHKENPNKEKIIAIYNKIEHFLNEEK